MFQSKANYILGKVKNCIDLSQTVQAIDKKIEGGGDIGIGLKFVGLHFPSSWS